MGNEPSRAQPLNILTPVRRWWGRWLTFSWLGAEHVWPVNAITKRPLKEMRFIHFAHWGLLTHMPAQGGERLPRPYIVFSTNFNGDVNAYLDAFAILIPWRMRALWAGAYGFPGPEPLGCFRRYVMERAIIPQHYYCAYPQASVKMILAGLTLQDELESLVRAARDGDDESFAQRWAQFVAEHGNRL